MKGIDLDTVDVWQIPLKKVEKAGVGFEEWCADNLQEGHEVGEYCDLGGNYFKVVMVDNEEDYILLTLRWGK